jgi:amino acid adenylation domain-containing protein
VTEMSALITRSQLSPEQVAIRAKCFHPSGTFVEFKKEDIELSFPERFEAIVRLYSDRIAIKTTNQVVTFADLNAVANRLARAILAARGTTSEPIGLLLDNRPVLFAAMLGVLKAGKFFVAVDPSLPKAQIVTLLEDSQATLVITNQHHLTLAAEGAIRCPLLDLDSIDQSMPSTSLCLPVSADAPALIFYTSGSSGAAKAVLWTHRVLLHHLMLTTNAFHACAEDRISLLASGTSGAVTNGLFALQIGAALLPFDVRKEGVARLASWLSEERISICWFSPPLFRTLSETLTGKGKFAALRLIRLAGDAAYQSDVDLYKQHFPRNCLLVNALSSSEAGFLSIYYLDHASQISGIEVPVGYPVADKEILLLDEEGKEVGFNEVGEIVVKSCYLSSGYWYRPDLTDSKFRPHSGDGEPRLYFTGDLAVMRPDGCLIYKGRKDFRVKIRGYGVEFAAVEKVLLELEAIREVVVAAPKNESGEARLVAYFTAQRPNPSAAEIRDFATKTLPDYMIPTAFVKLQEMPLTPSGKIDRNRLPEPEKSRPETGVPYVRPRTPVEMHLAEIWAEILCLNEVGVYDNFFDLGGHSLAATRVLSKVLKTFQLELPLQSLFRSPTVAEMAAVITEQQGKKLDEKELQRILTELESLSEDDAHRILSDQSKAAGTEE